MFVDLSRGAFARAFVDLHGDPSTGNADMNRKRRAFQPSCGEAGLETRLALSGSSGLSSLLPSTSFNLQNEGQAILDRLEALAQLNKSSGSFSGNYSSPASAADAGSTLILSGAGHGLRLGPAWISGQIQEPGLIANGHVVGNLTLQNKHGSSLLIRFTGVQDSAASAANEFFTYEVEGGTGAFANAYGSGQLQLTIRPNSVPTPSSAGTGGFTVNFLTSHIGRRHVTTFF